MNLNEVIEFASTHLPWILLLVSEVLPMTPWFKGNGILHSIGKYGAQLIKFLKTVKK